MSQRYSPVTAYGLSPRVRGNRSPSSVGMTIPGSIPACAGEPSAMLLRRLNTRVYPRVCGGTNLIPIARRAISGLSPRVRGNPLRCQFSFLHTGSIPACAGEPLLSTWISTAMKVYPRVCGGTAKRNKRPVFACPAVYPRVCGGTATIRRVLHNRLSKGLSPRVRGNHCTMSWHSRRIRQRSIPACAGEPSRFAIHQNFYIDGSIPACAGEPTPKHVALAALCIFRSIPACAGEPQSMRV